jgi:hypothetical protein
MANPNLMEIVEFSYQGRKPRANTADFCHDETAFYLEANTGFISAGLSTFPEM